MKTKIDVIFVILLGFLVAMILNAALGTLPDTPNYTGLRESSVTIQMPYIQVASVTADATDLASTTSDWESCQTNFTYIPPEWSNLTFSFYGYGDGVGVGSPDNATFSYKFYLVNMYGGAQWITTGTGAIGAQQMATNPSTGADLNSGAVSANYCWADTITEGTVSPTRDIGYTDYEGNNGVGELHFDRYSGYGVQCIITDMTAQAVTSVTCVMNGFNP